MGKKYYSKKLIMGLGLRYDNQDKVLAYDNIYFIRKAVFQLKLRI